MNLAVRVSSSRQPFISINSQLGKDLSHSLSFRQYCLMRSCKQSCQRFRRLSVHKNKNYYCIGGIFSFLGKMSYGYRSTGSSSSQNSRNKSEAVRAVPKGVEGNSTTEIKQISYEDEYPSLADSYINSKPSSKRRTRLDLETRIEKPLENENGGNDPFQHEASKHGIITDNDDLGLPTSFGKKCSMSARNGINKTQNCREHERNLKLSQNGSSGGTWDEPFDICPYTSVRRNFNRSPMAREYRQTVKPNDKNEPLGLTMIGAFNKFEETGKVLRPGMVLFKQYLTINEQVNIVAGCRSLGLGLGGFYRPGYKDGAKLRLYIMCLGLDWNPQTKGYSEIRLHDNVEPPRIPSDFTSLVGKILYDSNTLIKKDSELINVDSILPQMSPDVCIVNFYTTAGRLGLHQDRDESSESLRNGLPVVSISIGDTAEFIYGDTRDVDKADRILLESGDVLIFGGASRHIFHGVTNIKPETAPSELLRKTNLRAGRLNLTFRKY